MTQSPALKSLLFDIRQHSAFQELLSSVEQPRLPRFRPLQKQTLDVAGAQTVFASGEIEQHERWLRFLTGAEPKTGQEQPPV